LHACRTGLETGYRVLQCGGTGRTPGEPGPGQIRARLHASSLNSHDLVRALDTLPMRPVIDATFTLDNIADAFRHQMVGVHFGKIALTI
jgi:NADPH:quinone reductase-like Zn-dependent oxidoreductase